uniref:Uncharacterized protein n=1 Tax=Triticum urartu TaxID=4572 RepID=A0A8R7K0N7_TRIUA
MRRKMSSSYARRESYMEVSLREMGLMEKKRKQRRVFLRRSAGSKTVRGRTSCLWRGKSRGFGRRSNQRSRRTRPLSCISATSPMLL